ncbi:MAG: hypothetical protein ISR57_07850 [Bacteroidales bacterium]|nr:hypothetical protein [Bacteroidales bacterium]
MKTNRKLIIGLIFLAFIMLQIPQNTQGQMIVEVSGGAGYSFMNVEAWTGYNPDSYINDIKLDDWSQLMYQVYLQFYPLNFFGRLAIGVEGGYQNYLSYDLKERYDDGSGQGWKKRYREDRYSAWRVLILARGYIVKGFFAEVGGGMYFVRDYIEWGGEVSLGYEIKLTKNLYLPIKVRTEFIFDSDGNIIAPGATFGLAFHFGGKKRKNR